MYQVLAIKSMNKYLKKLPFNYFHYYAIAVLIVLLGLNNKMFFVLYIPFYYLIKNYKNKLSVIIVSLVLLFSCITYENINKRKPAKNTFIVVKKTFNNDYYTYYVKQGFNQYIFYNSEQLNIGDEIIVDYEYEEFTKNKRPNSFNFKNYYASKRVFYKLIVKDIKVAKNKFHLNKIKEKLFNKLNKYPENTAKYLKMFLFSHDDFDEQLNKT